MRLFAVQWLPKRKKFPKGLIQQTGFPSFEAALYFACRIEAKSIVILRGSTEGINANKLFLDFILK